MTDHRSSGLTVVVATYERPSALDAVLWSLSDQSDSDFDLVVADDGSGPETAAVVDEWRKVFGERLGHVWQSDDGYRLARVRNLGALEAAGDYLVFIDGDVVPRRHFVRALRRSAVRGWFVAGKRLLLSRELTRQVLEERLPIQRWSFARWATTARRQAEPLEALTARDRRRPGRSRLPEFVPHANGYGFLLGVAWADFARVNGYDGAYRGWGDEDIDLAIRLRHLGLRCGWPGPRATLLHLWHESRKVGGLPNKSLLRDATKSGRTRALAGLDELSP